ncbi:MAG: hypothetical protein AAF327_11025 [Cyanobacteria bacterium P01_A01_bin.37]
MKLNSLSRSPLPVSAIALLSALLLGASGVDQLLSQLQSRGQLNASQYDTLIEYRYSSFWRYLLPLAVVSVVLGVVERELSHAISLKKEADKRYLATKESSEAQVKEAFEAVDTAKADLERQELNLANQIEDLQQRKTQLEKQIQRARESEQSYQRECAELGDRNARFLDSELQKRITAYVRENSGLLHQRIEEECQSILAQRAEIEDNFKAYQTSIRTEIEKDLERKFLHLERKEHQIQLAESKLLQREQQARLTIEKEKIAAKEDLKQHKERVAQQHSQVLNEAAQTKTWLEAIARSSKPEKAAKIPDTLALYEKFKSLLFEGVTGILKPVHCRFIAGTEGGKSSLVQNLLTLLTAEVQGLEIQIADGAGEYSQSDWGQLPRNFSGHEECLDGLERIDTLFNHREQGDCVDKHPVLFILDEADEVLRGQKGHALPKLLKRGRHQNIYIWLICQDKNIIHLGLSDSDRTNYSTIVLGNALTNFLNGDKSVLTPKQRQTYLSHWDKLTTSEDSARGAVFYCLIVSKHCPKPELVRSPLPKAFESLMNPVEAEHPPTTHASVKLAQETTLNIEEQRRIDALLEEFNGSLASAFDTFGALAKQIVGHPNRGKAYKEKKAYLVSRLQALGQDHLLPKEFQREAL